MPKLTAHYCKKLPTGQYSNDSYSASIDVEIDETDSQTMQAGLRRLFALVKDSVEQQFSGASGSSAHSDNHRPQTEPRTTAPVRNAAIFQNGRHVPATTSQKKAVFAICKSLGLDPKQYSIDGLSVKQASTLIDELKSQQDGN